MKLRTARIRSPSRRARKADGQDDSVVRGRPGTRARGRTPRSRSPGRRVSTRGTSRPRGRTVVASLATVSEPVQADLDDALDASIDPREVAAASSAPGMMDMFSLEDQSRAEQALVELE